MRLSMLSLMRSECNIIKNKKGLGYKNKIKIKKGVDHKNKIKIKKTKKLFFTNVCL